MSAVATAEEATRMVRRVLMGSLYDAESAEVLPS